MLDKPRKLILAAAAAAALVTPQALPKGAHAQDSTIQITDDDTHEQMKEKRRRLNEKIEREFAEAMKRPEVSDLYGKLKVEVEKIKELLRECQYLSPSKAIPAELLADDRKIEQGRESLRVIEELNQESEKAKHKDYSPEHLEVGRKILKQVQGMTSALATVKYKDRDSYKTLLEDLAGLLRTEVAPECLS
jgi:hypothetical protein